MPALHCRVAERCGGCPQLQLSLAEQREQKAAGLRRLLRDHGQDPERLAVWTGDPPRPFRNRIRMRLRHGKPEFFNPAKEHGCPVLLPSLWELIVRLRETCGRFPERLAAFSHLEIRAPDEDDQAVVTFYRGAPFATGDAREKRPPFATAAPLLTTSEVTLLGWSFDEDRRGEAPRQRRVVAPGTYTLVPSCSFVQVNDSVNRRLVQSVVSGLAERGAATFFELFSGAGNFTLPLLASGMQGTSVEQAQEAVQAASAAAMDQGLVGEFIHGDAWSVAQHRAHAGRRVDAVLSDAPRAGLKGRVACIAALDPAHIVLICCSPKSALRDAAGLQSHGYVLESVRPFDMFPHTAHTEVVLWMRRQGSPPPLGNGRSPFKADDFWRDSSGESGLEPNGLQREFCVA